MPTISERRELILKELHKHFPTGREFAVENVMPLKNRPGMSAALSANFGNGWGKLPDPVIAIKIGRLLEQKLANKKFGDFELFIVRRRTYGNLYRFGPAPEPTLAKILVKERMDSEGHIYTEILRDRNGEPLREQASDPPIVDKPAEPPKVAEIATGPPPTRPIIGRDRNNLPIYQPTKAELAARHPKTQGVIPSNYDGWGTGRPITPHRGNFNL